MDCPTIYRGTTPTITLNVHGIDFSDAVTWPVVSLKAGAQRLAAGAGYLAILNFPRPSASAGGRGPF